MMKKYHYLILLLLICSFSGHAQYGKQKRADKLFNNLAYLEATDVYKELIANNYNFKENSLKLGDAYMKLRSPENAVFYYGDVIDSSGISSEYYYKYAQALRGTKRYQESRDWLKKYLETGANSVSAEEALEKDEYEPRTTYKLKKAEFNSDLSDFGAFEKDGIIYFVSARAEGVAEKDRIYSWNGEPFLDVYQLDTASMAISPVSGEINTKLHDGPLVISPDGKTAYFNRNNYLGNKEGKRDKKATNNLKIYKATLTGNVWTDVEELPFNDKSYSVGHPALSPDGKTLYFTSDMPGGIGGSDLYKVSINADGTYGLPQNLGEKINTPREEAFAFIDKDSTLYFSSTGHGGLGLMDIFRIDLKDENAEPENLGEPVNSNLDDFAFFKISDSNKGYISSNRDANSDDIYSFNQLNPLILKGTVTDAVNDKPIASATVRLMDNENTQLAFLETNEDGEFSTAIARDSQFPIEAKEIKYQTFTGTVDTRNSDEKDTLVYNIQLQPVKDPEYLAEIDTIYFDFDKYNIRPDAARELDKLVKLMTEDYPEMVIAIGAHTDKRGTNAYNDILAERRAKSTYDYLIAHGINEDRIESYKGYGENQPAIECDRCTREQHQLNRRALFEVVRMEN
ncbi:OmpA family protein [Zunongwangia sp. F363]|uniref:OmpA family protein n=1 Tax=Autumnicola tepida TaxID=3075595 RepID=A0ABU3CDL0_9FLAO|nr:OmpA family protein [Zunongwangia sp. F363]MDT0644386.1 OmpA family protein [Zunongwangia sp. F363]